MAKKLNSKEELQYQGPIIKSLPDVPEILQEHDVLLAISIQKDKQERKIIRMIQEFQSKCPHDGRWENIGHWTQRNFLGRRCALCKVFKPKPKGLPWKICTECGTEMVFSHIYDEQRVHVYRCPNCKHKEEVT